MKKISYVILSCLCVNALADNEFSELDVIGKDIKSNFIPFTKAGANSVRVNIDNSAIGLDKTIRTIPGAYTQIDQAQGGISVNIRGMTGFGRVNTLVDGVNQTFFSSSGNQSVHGGVGTSSFSTNIDSNFLTSIDVDKGDGKLTNKNGGLMGSVNLKTIGVDDVLSKGNKFGFLGKYSYGFNSVGANFMGAVAAKDIFLDKYLLGILFAYSGKNTSEDYKTGSGLKIDKIDEDNGSALNVAMTKNKPRSNMFKLEFDSDYSNFILSYRNFKNDFITRKIENNNYQFSYNYDLANNILDLNLLLALSEGKQKYKKGTQLHALDADDFIAKNRAVIFDINNTSRIEFGDFNNELNLGINLLNNKYSNDFKNNLTLNNTAYPQGVEEIKTLYLNNTFNANIFTFDTNFNYTQSTLSGARGECLESNIYCFPKKASSIEKTYSNFNYSFMLSADISPYFKPFVSYSKTSRAPTVQEFFGTYNNFDDKTSLNTTLKPETAKTYQIGFNIFKQDFIFKDDYLGFKAVYFNSKIKNYIYDRTMVFDDQIPTMSFNDSEISKSSGVELELQYDAGNFYMNLAYSYQKSKYKTSDSESLEVVGTSSGQKQFAKLPKYVANINLGSRLFDKKLDFGFNVRLTGKASRISPESSFDNDINNENAFRVLRERDDLPKIPSIVDLYANYEVFKGFKINVELLNAFNKNYVDALYVYNSTENQSTYSGFVNTNKARGRTFIIGFEYKY